jgi:hypothetical protein
LTDEEYNRLWSSTGARAARGAIIALASYALLRLQPHYDFNFLLFACAVFSLAMLNNMQQALKAILIFLLLAVFVPEGFVSKVATLIL